MSWSVLPISIDAVSWSSLTAVATSVTSVVETLTLHTAVSVFPEGVTTVAVIFASPSATAVTFPSSETFATSSLSEAYETLQSSIFSDVFSGSNTNAGRFLTSFLTSPVALIFEFLSSNVSSLNLTPVAAQPSITLSVSTVIKPSLVHVSPFLIVNVYV